MMPDTDKKRILVVDDDKEMSFLIASILEKNDYTVLTAEDGPSAIEKSNQHDIDLILLDVMMPFFSGFFFCDAFKHRSRTKNVPVVIVSSLSKESDIQKAYQMGASAFLKKPFQAEQLLETVRKIFS